MAILLVGQGNMAIAVKTACESRNINCMHAVEDVDYDYPIPNVVAIHFGSGRQLPELIDLCERMRIPIIQGSTKLSVPIPTDRDVTIINAPNLSLPMIRFVTAFPQLAQAIMPGMQVRIVESHQSKKADTSGTARAVANALGISEAEISSIRDPGIQLARGIPEDHLGGHAFHDFIFTGEGVKIRVSTEIVGRKTYAEGALTLAQALVDLKTPLGAGVHELKDILHLLPVD
jgi:dihydrodipicolinate reductase